MEVGNSCHLFWIDVSICNGKMCLGKVDKTSMEAC